jgi:hypothetical protein
MLAFSFFNWKEVEVNLWENLILETKVPVLVIIAFLLGLVPMWLYHRSVKWSLNRRVRSLEASIKSNALSQRHEPAATRATVPVEDSADNPAKAEDSLSLQNQATTARPHE